MASTAKVFSFSQILSLFSSSKIYNQLIDEIQKGFINYSNQTVYVAPVIHLGNTGDDSDPNSIPKMIGNGDVCLKSGYIINDKYYVIKIAGGGFTDSPNSGVMLVFSQRTGSLNGILLDNGILTEIRTAAASALATKYFAPKNIQNIGIVGTGIQSRYQLDILQHIMPNINNINVYIYGRNKEKAKIFKKEMNEKHDCFNISIANDLFDIGGKCQLIIMCTSARSPVLMEKHLFDTNGNLNYKKYGLHINCIGADTNGKNELDENIITKYTDLIMVDSKQQCLEFGEMQHVIKKNKMSKNDGKIKEFGEILQEKQLNIYQRKPSSMDKRVTLFDSTGVAVQDVVISKMVYEMLTQSKSCKL